ncbi:MAG: S-layer homology domain-containing protein [Firmicutes bacterium]|nr:S-layer homology domain-containing protein [Bacillota bacterium]
MKRKSTVLLAAMMSLAMGTTGMAASFADIGNVPWAGAETYINKVADLGIMVGETNNGKSTFRPKDGVTICETIQLTYSLVKAASGATAASKSVVDKWTSVMSGYKIPQWAQEATAYCLENQIITVSDLPGFMNADGSSRAATREMVAYVIGKGMVANEQSFKANATSVAFNDSSSISSQAVPYVAMLKDTGILSGDNGGNFNAKNAINRSEMAVVVTKTYDVLKKAATQKQPVSDSGSVSGFASNIVPYGNGIMVAMNVGGQTKSIYISDITNITYMDGKSAKPTDITGGQVLVVTYSQNNATTVVIQENSPSKSSSSATEVTGLISALDSNKIRLTGETEYRHFYDRDILINFDDDTISPKDFVERYKDIDETVRATLSLDSEGYVTRITASVLKDSMKGYISDIDKNEIELDDSKSTSYKFNDPEVTLDGKKSTLSDIIKAFDGGDEIYVVIQLNSNDRVTSIDADTRNDGNSNNNRGTLSKLSSSSLKIKNGGTFKIDDTDGIDITLDGKSVDFEDLEEAYKDGDTIYVNVKVDKNDNVTEIDADTKGTSESKKSGTVSSLTTRKIELSNGDSYNVDPDDVDVTINGKSKDFDDLRDAYKDGDKITVTLKLRNNYVIEIEAKTTAKSSSKNEGDTSGELKKLYDDEIVLENGDKFDVEDPDGIYVTLDGKNSSYNELKSRLNKGDKIYVELKLYKKLYVTEIEAETR